MKCCRGNSVWTYIHRERRFRRIKVLETRACIWEAQANAVFAVTANAVTNFDCDDAIHLLRADVDPAAFAATCNAMDNCILDQRLKNELRHERGHGLRRQVPLHVEPLP